MPKQNLFDDIQKFANELDALVKICDGTDPRASAFRACASTIRQILGRHKPTTGELLREDAIDRAVAVLEYHCKGDDLIETAVELLLQAMQEED